MSQALSSQDKALPTVFAAHIGADNLDLWVAPADPSPPEPWTAADGGAVWRLPLQAVTEAGLDGASGVLAPYPGLVSIGTNETGRILVDLEVAHGLVAVRGPHRPVQAALAALAVELATNRWSDQMRITLVGFGEELAMIAPGRVTAVATLDEALPQLQARATEIEQALAESGRDSVLTGRSRTADAQTWAPHYLIMAAPPTPTQRERLLTLARTRHRTALGFVIAGDIRGATWTWEVTEDGRLKADVLGFDLAAQLLPPDQYGAVVELFRAAQGDGVDLTDPSDDGAPAAQLVPGARMPVEIGLLGPVTIDAPGPVDGPRQAVSTELAVYLATHPGGVHPNVLTGAIWPRGVTPEVRDAAVARVQAWLGTDDMGRPNLTTDAGGRLRLGSQVRVDWLVFRALLAQAGHAAERGDTDEEAAALDRALGLVRGQILDGRDPSRYAWLGTDSFTYEATALIADAAHRLSALRLMAGDAEGAMDSRPGRAAAGLQRRDALARAAARRVRDRPGTRAARGGRRGVGARRTGRGDAADGTGDRGAHRRAAAVVADVGGLGPAADTPMDAERTWPGRSRRREAVRPRAERGRPGRSRRREVIRRRAERKCPPARGNECGPLLAGRARRRQLHHLGNSGCDTGPGSVRWPTAGAKCAGLASSAARKGDTGTAEGPGERPREA